MRRVNITAQMLSKCTAEDESVVLEDTYHNYDSKLVVEDLKPYEVKSYLDSRPDIVKSGYVYYEYDEEGIATIWVTQRKAKYRRFVISKGFYIVRNKLGTYDVHEFWRQ